MSPAAGTTALLIAMAVKATVLLTLAAVVERAILRRRASAAARHLLWTFTFSGLFLLPALAWTMPHWRVPLLPPRAPAMLHVERPAPPFSSHSRRTDADEAPPNASNVRASDEALLLSAAAEPSHGGRGREGEQGPVVPSWTNLLLGLYVAGVLLLLLKVVAEQLAVRQLARKAAPVNDEWRTLVESIGTSLGVRRPVSLFRIDTPTMPLTWGLIRPAVLLPAVADEWPDSRRRAVLLHELAHVARYDCLTQTLAAIACALYWPHPGAWWAAGRLRFERELACDDQAMESGVRPREYAGHLLELARGLSTPRALSSLAVGMASPSHLETRLSAALDSGRARARPCRRARVLGAVLTALLLVPLAAVRGGAAEGTYAAAATQRSDEGETRQTRGRPDGAAKAAHNAVETPGTALDTTAVAAANTGPAQEAFAGTWAVRLATSAEIQADVSTVHVALWAPGLNTFYTPVSHLDGISAEQIASSLSRVRFYLIRDAGSFTFEGSIRGGRGTGRFDFAPDPAFAAALVRRGMERPTPRQQFSLARHDVGLAFLDELAAQGYERPTTQELVRAGTSGADLRYLREMGALGYRLGTLNALVRMSNSSVTTAYIRALSALGYGGLSAADLVRMQNHSLSADTVQRMNARAGRQLSVNELLNLRMRVDTPADIPASTASTPVGPAASTPLAGRWILSGTRGAAARLELRWDDDTQWRRAIELAELSGISGDEITSDASLPVTFRVEQDAGTFDFEGSFQAGSGTGRFRFQPNHRFIPVLRSLGVGGVGEVTDHQLKNLAFGAISAVAVREFQSLGFESLTLGDLLDLAIRQVTPAYARQLQSLGVSGADTVSGLIDLRFSGVPVAYVRELATLGHRGISASTIIAMREAGVTPAFIRSVREAGRGIASPEELIAMKERERAERRVR